MNKGQILLHLALPDSNSLQGSKEQHPTDQPHGKKKNRNAFLNHWVPSEANNISHGRRKWLLNSPKTLSDDQNPT